MNKDIDIREHSVIIKYDKGEEEFDAISSDIGKNTQGEYIRIVVVKNKSNEVTCIRVQNL